MSSPSLPPPGSPSSIPSPVSTLPPSDDSASAESSRLDTTSTEADEQSTVVVAAFTVLAWPRGVLIA